MDHASALQRYERAGAASAEMLDAAKGGDWDRFVLLQRAYSEALAGIPPVDPGTSAPGDSARVIRRILDDHAEAQELARARMRELGDALAGAGAASRAATAYRLDAGA